ncbi:MAG: DUF6348 family protein [Ruminococcus flavefaciens]|mgnify:CR=1 FL=1|nr:MAG: hypothetical protein BWZ04_00277 [Firmicutes bacterium ADurb.BinA205]HOC33169.1 DUF6348 family protein [Ruminococcus flavefaciens]HQL99635.1 DUF6348 family protein [Ruminococcus flavefaciens]
MALFKKNKNQQAETEEQKDTNAEVKQAVLDKLNEKLKGTIYDDCIILPKGYTIDVQIGRTQEAEGVKMIQIVFIVKNDDFDEPLIEPVDAQGNSEEEAAQMAADMFFGAVWHPLDQAMSKKNPVHISVDYLRQHYDFDMYCQSVIRIGIKEKQPVMLMNYIKTDLPKYLGSKKYYWIRVYLAKFQDKQVCEVRVNGSVCTELSKRFQPYIDGWDAEENFLAEKQYAIFVQREDDQCPYKKEIVIDGAKECIEKMVKLTNRDEYIAMSKELEESITAKLSEDIEDHDQADALGRSIAAEIRIFIPEILAKLTLGYTEGDSLFLLEGEGDSQQSIEFKKTQLRSYFYLQQAVLEYLSTRPEQQDVTRIVTNSVAFREMRKVMDQAKEQNKELNPADLFVPGTSYKIGVDGYKVW